MSVRVVVCVCVCTDSDKSDAALLVSGRIHSQREFLHILCEKHSTCTGASTHINPITHISSSLKHLQPSAYSQKVLSEREL